LFLHPIDKIRELAQQQIGGSARYTFSTLPVISRLNTASFAPAAQTY